MRTKGREGQKGSAAVAVFRPQKTLGVGPRALVIFDLCNRELADSRPQGALELGSCSA